MRGGDVKGPLLYIGGQDVIITGNELDLLGKGNYGEHLGEQCFGPVETASMKPLGREGAGLLEPSPGYSV